MDMRGLAHFIRDIRNATSNKHDEELRVNEELAKIRTRFLDTTRMTIYQRKKYVCKLMFITMLGYPVTFGHMEGIRLMAGETASEKLIGYLAMTVLLNERSELMTATIHTVYRDLISGVHLRCALALTAIANAGDREFAAVMHNAVQHLVTDEAVDLQLRKKALLAMRRVYMRYPEVVDTAMVVTTATSLLRTAGDTGVVMCAIALLDACVAAMDVSQTQHVTDALVDILHALILAKTAEPGYVYYGVPAPWLQVMVLRLLQRVPAPTHTLHRERVTDTLHKIVKATAKVLTDAQAQQKQRGTRNRVCVISAVLVEVVKLVLCWGGVRSVGCDDGISGGDDQDGVCHSHGYRAASKLIVECTRIVGSFLTDKREANMRYTGLALLAQLHRASNADIDFNAYCKLYWRYVLVSLHDRDVSIRRKALQVVGAACTVRNVVQMLHELTSYLPIVREREYKVALVHFIADLSEQYSCAACQRDGDEATRKDVDGGISADMYVDTMLAVIANAGDVCPATVAQRVLERVLSTAELQKRACTQIYALLRQQRLFAPQLVVRIAAFLLGEFGYQIALNVESTPRMQCTLLQEQLGAATTETASVLLTALAKLYNLYEDVALRTRIRVALRAYAHGRQAEQLQQRSQEYLSLMAHGSAELLARALAPCAPLNTSLTTTNAVTRSPQQGLQRRTPTQPHQLTNAVVAEQAAVQQTSCIHNVQQDKGVGGDEHEALCFVNEQSANVVEAASRLECSLDTASEQHVASTLAMFATQEACMLQQLRAHTQRTILDAIWAADGTTSALYSDDHIDIHCTRQCRLADARLTIDMTTKASETQLSSATLHILHIPAGLLVQMRPQERDTATHSSTARFYVAARSLDPYRDAPRVQLRYKLAGVEAEHAVTLTLPILTMHYCESYEARDGNNGNNANDDDRDATYVALTTNVGRKAFEASATVTINDPYGRAAQHAAQILQRLRFDHVARSTDDDNATIEAIAAHATQRDHKIRYSKVRCTVAETKNNKNQQHYSTLQIVVYANNNTLSSAMLAALQQQLHTYSTTQVTVADKHGSIEHV